MAERMVKHKVFFIWDWEAEEIWLNRMAKQGWNLIKVGFCRYEFEKGEPGQWQYRLQAMEKHASTEESQKYLEFVESMDIEVVDTFLYWAYFRQKTEKGPFEIFSDQESRIRHMKRIMGVIYAILPILLINLFNMTHLMSIYDGSSPVLFVLCVLLIAFMAIFTPIAAYGLWRMHKKLKVMQAEKSIQP